MTIYSRRMPEGLKRLAGLLSLLFLPALGLEVMGGVNRPHSHSSHDQPEYAQQIGDQGSRPYLTVSATPALRVRDPSPPPIYDTEPAPPGPGYLDENFLTPAPPVAQERMDSAQGMSRSPAQQDRQRHREEEEIPAILPDDLRKEVRPEDVIPFFQFPGSGGSSSATLPVPGQPPAPGQIPSSATYRQQ